MQYAGVPFDDESVFFIQSARADDLQTRIAERIATQAGQLLSSFFLAGAGDGHTFVALLGFIADDPSPALTDVTIKCYLAADAENLALARAAAVSGLSASNKADEPIAGASKGTRFMGAVVIGTPNT